MAENPRPETTTIVLEAQRERARFAEAAAWAEEVLERVSGRTTAAGTSCPSTIPAVVDQEVVFTRTAS